VLHEPLLQQLPKCLEKRCEEHSQYRTVSDWSSAIFAYSLYFEKIKIGLRDHLAVCMCIPRLLLNAQSLWNLEHISCNLRLTSWIPSISNTTTAASITVEVITLPEHLNKSSWNLVCISCHLSSSQWHTAQIPPISNINTAASQIVLFYWLHYAYILKFFVPAISDTQTVVKGKEIISSF
jgi:hypothetical protein